MSVKDGWLTLPCPCPADQRNGECDGEVSVWMDGGMEGESGRSATMDVKPCTICGYGSTWLDTWAIMNMAEVEDEHRRHV